MNAKVFIATLLACSQVTITNAAVTPDSIDIVDRNRMIGMTLGAHPHVVPLNTCEVTSVTKHYKNNELQDTEERHIIFGEAGRVEKLQRDKTEYIITYDDTDILVAGPVNYRIKKRDNILYWHHSEDQRSLDSYAYRSYIEGEDERKYITEAYDKAQQQVATHWNTILPTGVYFGYGKKNETDVRWQWTSPNKVARYRVGSQVIEVHLIKPDQFGNPTRTEAWLMDSAPKRVNITDYTFKYCS